MTIHEIAKDIAALNQAGKFKEAGEKYWADDVVSIEPMPGEMAELRGKDAVRGKSQWWSDNHEVHSVEVGGPYVNGDQFVLRFTIDVTQKGAGKRMQMDEVGLYTIKNGKIAEERFFFAG